MHAPASAGRIHLVKNTIDLYVLQKILINLQIYCSLVFSTVPEYIYFWLNTQHLAKTPCDTVQITVSLAAVTNHLLMHWCLLFTFAFFYFFIFRLFSPFPLFVVIMTSRCFNFRFAYPLPLLPHLHTARMASGHPTDKFSFMYQPDTHKRYGARMYTHSYTHINALSMSVAHVLNTQVSCNNTGVFFIFTVRPM